MNGNVKEHSIYIYNLVILKHDYLEKVKKCNIQVHM